MQCTKPFHVQDTCMLKNSCETNYIKELVMALGDLQTRIHISIQSLARFWYRINNFVNQSTMEYYS